MSTDEYKNPSRSEFDRIVSGLMKLVSNLKTGKLQESDKNFLYLSEGFFSCSVIKDNDFATELKWIAMKSMQGKKGIGEPAIDNFNSHVIKDLMLKMFLARTGTLRMKSKHLQDYKSAISMLNRFRMTFVKSISNALGFELKASISEEDGDEDSYNENVYSSSSDDDDDMPYLYKHKPSKSFKPNRSSRSMRLFTPEQVVVGVVEMMRQVYLDFYSYELHDLLKKKADK